MMVRPRFTPRAGAMRGGLMMLGACAALAGAASGCVGNISDPGSEGGTYDGGENRPDGVIAAVALPDAPVNTEPPECAAPFEPGPAYMRRLTNDEYARTVRDLLGQTADPTTHFTRDAYNAGFDNNVASLHVAERNAEDYLNAAEAMTHAVLTTPARRTMVLGCDPASATDRAACVRSFVQNFGRRAFRRPLETDEVTQFVALANLRATDPDPYAGVALVLESMLQSPNFLFRVEVGAADPARTGFNRLTGYETASRLAYLLWGSTPDAALLDTAQAGMLDTAAGIETSARAMLTDPRAHEAITAFYSQWLRLYDLDEAAPDAALFPAWNPALRDAMIQENQRFVDDFVWRDGANFLDAVTARYSYVNGGLASLYGVRAPTGATWARVDFGATDERAGLLTQAAFLAGHARPDSDSPTRRGKYVREVMLCQEMPAPPPDVPALPPAVPGQSNRDRLESHRTNPACSGCHTLMDPVGFGFERYGALGALQTMDTAGRPLTGQGSLAGFTSPAFTGAVELAARIRNAPEYPRCVVEKTFRFALGRVLADTDGCALARVNQSFSTTNYGFREMVLALVVSDSFRYVHPGASEAGGGM